ncbi:MAG: OmpA family protein [Mediterranea sp.]|nr:OmpA family protein [Mediterranea sp.]
MRPVYGISLSKQLTPLFGFEMQGMANNNMTPSATGIDMSEVAVVGKVNLTNAFRGYQGMPRPFEVEAIASIGWLHYFYDNATKKGGDPDSWSTRLGLNFNCFFGKEKQWGVNIRPVIFYDMQGDFMDWEGDYTQRSSFNFNHAGFELTVGGAYYFKIHGKRHISKVRVYDDMEVGQLNESVNRLRKKASDYKVETDSLELRNEELEKRIKELLVRKPVDREVDRIDTLIKVKEDKQLEILVFFGQGRATIDASQMPNVARIATYMHHHGTATVNVKGYASPEGNLELNARLAHARAEAVRNALISRYGISGNRITAEGLGVGDAFSEPDWNRVSICKIND